MFVFCTTAITTIRRRFLRRQIRHLSSSSSSSTSSITTPLSHPTYLIWGSGTGLGKTLVSTGLASSTILSSLNPTTFIYIKPVQTGFPLDSDARFLYTRLSHLFRRRETQHFTLFASNHALKASVPASESVLGYDGIEQCGNGLRDLGMYEESKMGCEGYESRLICKTLCSWKEAVSPHLAVQREGGAIGDSSLLQMLQTCLGIGLDDVDDNVLKKKMDVWTVIETAGGVASPGPSGSFQCDLYRPFRLPGILVGDGRLGGISGTISAYESLKLRGYDVAAIIFEDHGLANEVPLLSYLRNRVPVLVLPPVPQDLSDDLTEWFDKSQDVFTSLKETMQSSFNQRILRLREMTNKAGDIIWWPFTQHKLVPQETVTVIDSRCGENFAVYKGEKGEFINQQFDACASWWTQGPDATLQTELARDVGYAAARFGHVMFPENIYEPALECAELLLEGVGKGWASRVFYSDNGSTAIEIALKMAFRKYFHDHGLVSDILKSNTSEKCIELKVLALKGSYHGDTLGAMEAQAPSSYTGVLQQPWYTGRGLFLDPPTAFLCDGKWKISFPNETYLRNLNIKTTTFSSRDEIFCKSRDNSDLAENYASHISQQLSQYKGLMNSLTHIGALIIEPVIHGAGGMHMIDPLFQRVLVNECRMQNIPIIFDEVFTGFWRLGVETAAELLCCVPDIACFAKLMTGGVIPLAVTLASDAVFSSFSGDSKLKALLHGHSYSAHALGCTAAAKSIKWFKDPQTNCNISSGGGSLMELWDSELVHQISAHPAVERAVVLGTLCAVELHTNASNAGYASLYASSLVQKLREDGVYMRPLGNVIYLMCGPCTPVDICREILRKLYNRIDEFHHFNHHNLKSCML